MKLAKLLAINRKFGSPKNAVSEKERRENAWQRERERNDDGGGGGEYLINN